MSHQQTLHLPTGQAITMAPDGSQTKTGDSAGVAAAALYAQPVGTTTVLAQMPIYSANAQTKIEDDDERISYNTEAIASMGTAVATRRVPCKARGIAEHHNSATAYFDIPLDAPHGMLLLCSHPACHGSGRRFRYCKICELPVAKRNFVKRHSHDLKPSVISSTAAPPPAPPPLQVTAPGETARLTAVPVPIRWPSEQRKRRSVSYDAADTLNRMMQQGTTGGESASKKARSNVTTNAAPMPSILKIPAAPAPATTAGGLITMTMAVGSREHQWMQLLQARPSTDDSDEMPTWMSSVIAISEGASSADPITVTPPSPAQQASAPIPTVTWEHSSAAPENQITLTASPGPTVQLAAPTNPVLVNAPPAHVAAAAQANGFANATPAPAPTPVSWTGMNVTVSKVAAAPTRSMVMPPPPSSLNGTVTTSVSSLQTAAPAPTVTMQPAAPIQQALTVTMQPATRTQTQPSVTMQPAVAPLSNMAPAPAILHLAAPAPASTSVRQTVVQQAIPQTTPAPTAAPTAGPMAAQMVAAPIAAPIAAPAPVVVSRMEHAQSPLPQKPEVSV